MHDFRRVLSTIVDHNSKHLPGLRLLADVLQSKLALGSNEEMEEGVSDVFERALCVDTIGLIDVKNNCY